VTIVVGYIPTPEGSAAVDAAIAEAQLKGSEVVVVNTGNFGNFAHPNFATAQDIDTLDGQLTEAGSSMRSGAPPTTRRRPRSSSP
jgi:pyridoxal/pyridoxine/pyridoxamine kinase